MMELPAYIPITFAATSLLSVLIFARATQKPLLTGIVLLAWLAVQAIISRSGFYTVTDVMPPRFLALMAPPLFVTILLFATRKGRAWLETLDLKRLTWLHLVRVPVEIVLFWLCLHKAIPQLMTFEGRNFDIVSGLTAPLIYYFGFMRPILNRPVIIAWNVLCLILLLNIVVHAILSAPVPFQLLAFDQPNIAILYFPFVWLPCCVVPLVLLAHLVTIWRLLKKGNNT